MNQKYTIGQHVRVIAINPGYNGEHGYKIGDIIELVKSYNGDSFQTQDIDGHKRLNNYVHISEIEPLEEVPLKYEVNDIVVVTNNDHPVFGEGEHVVITSIMSEDKREYVAQRLDITKGSSAHTIKEDNLRLLSDEDVPEVAEESTTRLLKMDDYVPMAVVIDGKFKGIVGGATEVELILEDEANEGASEAWLIDNVKLYPVLSDKAISIDIELKEDYDVEVGDEDLDDEEYIVYLNGRRLYSFADEDDLKKFIREGLRDGDFTEDEVDNWELTRVVSERVTVEIERDDAEVDVTGAYKYVRDYVAPPLNYAQMNEEQLNNLIEQLTILRDGKLGN